MTGRRWRWLGALAVVVVAGGAYYVWRGKGEQETKQFAQGTHVVTRGALTEAASAAGTVEPHVQIEVKSRVSGAVAEVLVQEGDRVEVGQVLFRLDPTDADRAVKESRATLRRLQAELAQARASVSVAEAEAREAGTSADLATRGAELGVVAADSQRTTRHQANIAGANVRLRGAQVAAATAQLDAARLAVEESERRLAETEIRAPLAGTLLSVDVEQGSIVASAVTTVSGGSRMATLADLTDLRVVGQIDEAQIGKVQVEQDVVIRVDAYSDRTFTGKVRRVSPLGQNVSNVVVFDVEIVVTDRDASMLRSGMSADLEIITGKIENAVLVPLAAVQSEAGSRTVTLADGTRRRIRTGASDGSQIVVLDGLTAGERIMTATGLNRGAAPASGSGLVPTGRRPR